MIALKKRQHSTVLVFCLALILTATFIEVVKNSLLGSDFTSHAEWAELLVKVGSKTIMDSINSDGTSWRTYPLWHICYALGRFLGMTPILSTATVTAITNMICFIIVRKYLLKSYESNETLITLLAASLFFFAPIYIPAYNSLQYIGQSSPNIWHNPTNMFVKPFAIVSFIYICNICNKYDKKERINRNDWIKLSIVLSLSCLAKPSFIQIALPGMGLYLLIKSIREEKVTWPFISKCILTVLPCLCIVAIQFYINFLTSGGSAIIIAPFAVWKTYSKSILFSSLLVLAYPLTIFFLNRDNCQSNEFKVVLCLLLASAAEYALFAEPGKRFYYRNFSWGIQLAVFLVYLVATKVFLRTNIENDKINSRKAALITQRIMFMIQLFYGAYYFIYVALKIGAQC